MSITRNLFNYAIATGTVMKYTLLVTLLVLVAQCILGDWTDPMAWNLALFIMASVLTVTAAGVVFTGIPVYAIMKKLNIASLPSVAVAGFAIPIVVTVIEEYLSMTTSDRSYSRNYLGSHREMIIDGQNTVWGWLTVVESGALWGLCGLAAAVVFTWKMIKLENGPK